MSEPFLGEIRIFAGNFAPRGWAFCDGDLVAISQNTALFSLLGTTYGGDGRTTFGLPNLKARAAMHEGTGPGLSPRRLGQSGGSDTVTLDVNHMASHTHQLRGDHDPGEQNTPANTYSARTAANNRTYVDAANAGTLQAMASAAIPNSKGGGQAHNNLQPYLVMNFIIAMVGTYPSRS